MSVIHRLGLTCERQRDSAVRKRERKKKKKTDRVVVDHFHIV